MTNSRAKSKFLLVETHTAAGAEASHTFTFPSDDMENTSEYLLVFDLTATAQFALQLKINALTATYYQDGAEIAAGAETLTNIDNQAEWTIASTTAIGAGDVSAVGEIHIYLTKGATTDKPMMHSRIGTSVPVSHSDIGVILTDTSALTDIIIETSTSTWKTGSRFTLYKLTR